jgi:GNAT superfamily N-acetyltransferase
MPGRIVVRDRREDDTDAIVRLSLQSSSYYAALAPELFAPAEEDGFAEWLAADSDWRALPTSLALVAEVDGEVAGYLEATLEEPLDSARFNASRDLRQKRLFINAVLTANEHKRKGVATRLVEAAEAWGRGNGATIALCDTYVGSPQSVPFWETGMGYQRRSFTLRKPL